MSTKDTINSASEMTVSEIVQDKTLVVGWEEWVELPGLGLPALDPL